MREKDLEAMLEQALARIRERGTSRGVNLVAYSGGVDSTLAAALVARVFPANTRAVLGISASLSREQLQLARDVAVAGRFSLAEVETREGEREPYVENRGMACFYCKQTLYDTLVEFGRRHLAAMGRPAEAIVLYNGTNADDLEDPTRVGLQAARDFGVVSPLEAWTKAEVRALSRHLGLPNWGYAASPCLRSRLQSGVPATPENLARVERAEALVRRLLRLEPRDNLRVRHLEGGVARIELDAACLARIDSVRGQVEEGLEDLGFERVTVSAFRSGSLSFAV